MKLLLFTTDPSLFGLDRHWAAEDRPLAVVVPANRLGTKKVAAVQAAAQPRGLPVLVQPPAGNGAVEAFDQALRGLGAEVGISWLYAQRLPASTLAVLPRGILNLHGGRLPAYRGASVLQWSIINGETELGVTWHSMVEAVDAGPIWAESTVRIEPHETAWTVRAKMLTEGTRLFGECWPRFKSGQGAPVVPSLGGGRVWPQRTPADSALPAGLSERQLRDFIRALCPPWPRPFLAQGPKRYEVLGLWEAPGGGREAATLPYRLADGRQVRLVVQEGG